MLPRVLGSRPMVVIGSKTSGEGYEQGQHLHLVHILLPPSPELQREPSASQSLA